jgi:hypothetical protein
MCTACSVADHIPVVLAPPAYRSFAALRNPDCRFYLLGVLLPIMEGERF